MHFLRPYHVWCHFTVEKNLTFSSRSVLTTTGLGNKENSKIIVMNAPRNFGLVISFLTSCVI